MSDTAVILVENLLPLIFQCFKETGGNPVIYKVRKVEGVFPSSLSLSLVQVLAEKKRQNLSLQVGVAISQSSGLFCS